MSFQKRFGIRIKELRKTKNLTQEELGLKTGLNYKYIGAVERGERNLSLNSIKKIADGLQV
ncbi:MAG: helix-turn-helix domain-containing protein [Thermodesulfobacteriota bacterium]